MKCICPPNRALTTPLYSPLMKRPGLLSGIVILLLCAGAIFLANPSSWRLLNMIYGEARYGLIEADGAARTAVHGRKGPWPAWAMAPEGARVAPVVSYSAAPGHPAQGFGDAPIKAAPIAAMRALKSALEADGWTVAESRLDAAEPTLPPRPLVLCILRARRAGPAERSLLYSFQLEPPAASARIHWVEGAHPAGWDYPPTDC